jgi:hypothetical protein
VFQALSGGRLALIAFVVHRIVGCAASSPSGGAPCSAVFCQSEEIWRDRRNVAKVHDSYQWQKLFWVGLGLLPYAVVGDGLRNDEMAVTLFCLIGGAAGLVVWSRVNDAPTAAVPASR